jgi:hypothetical protein
VNPPRVLTAETKPLVSTPEHLPQPRHWPHG